MPPRDRNRLTGAEGGSFLDRTPAEPVRSFLAVRGDNHVDRTVVSGGTQNELVEFTPQGVLVAEYEIDAGAPGAAFGVAEFNVALMATGDGAL